MPPRKSKGSSKGKGASGRSGCGGRGKGGQSGAAAPAAQAESSVYGQCETNVNSLSKHHLQITEDLNSILAQEGLSDLLVRAGASRSSAAFDDDMFHDAMSEGGPGVYRCGGNALWASIATGPVAPNKNKLAELIKWQFSSPQKVFPETIVIGVLPPGGRGGLTPTDINARGNLVRLTPEEPHARLDHGRRQVHP